MINPIATESEAINSATYVDNYIDSVENLPDDVQRQLSRIRDIDVQYRGKIWRRTAGAKSNGNLTSSAIAIHPIGRPYPRRGPLLRPVSVPAERTRLRA